MHRMTSLSFARPPFLLNKVSVPLPELIDDEYLSETSEGHQPPGKPSRLAFFVYGMKLLDVRRRTRAVEYQSFNGSTRLSGAYSGQELGARIDLISDLDRFSNSLPSHLQTLSEFA